MGESFDRLKAEKERILSNSPERLRIAELEAENERLKKRIAELEPEPFPPDSEPVVWVCPPNNLEKRFEGKERKPND